MTLPSPQQAWDFLRELLQSLGAVLALVFLLRRELHRVGVTADFIVYAQLVGHEADPQHGEYRGSIRNDGRDVQIRSAYIDAGHGYSPMPDKLPVVLRRDELIEIRANIEDVETEDAVVADAFNWEHMKGDDLVNARIVFVCARGHEHAKSLDDAAKLRVRNFLAQRPPVEPPTN